jgi:ribonuclease HI
MKWSEEDVRDRWVADQYTIRRGWTAQDQKTLQTGVKRVMARKVEETKHRHVVPFPSKIDGNEWAVMETWYTCIMKAPDTGQVRTLLREGRDKQAAELLVTQGTLFWAPALTWQGWAASAPTSKAGWWVRATGVRMEKQEVILEIRSVQRDEFHRQGDIRVDGPDTLRKGQPWGLRQVMQATAPAMAVLAEDELERSAGGFRRCGALQAFREKEPKMAVERSEGQPAAPIQRPRGKKTVELPVIDFKVDWKASQGRLDTGPEIGKLAGVMCKKGQAHQTEAEKKQTMRRDKRSIRRGAPREKKVSDKKVIDETRWELLKLWCGNAAVQEWDEAWERTAKWELGGGRTLDWSITSELRRSRELQMMVRAHTLTADPSYERYLGEEESSSVKEGDRILVPLQEIGTQCRQSWVQACIEKAGHWVVIARKEDISMEQVRALEQHGKLIRRVKPEQRRCLEKGWWKTGERRRIKGRHEHLVWEKEQKGGAGDEKAGDKEGRVAGETEDAEAGNFWDPYQDPPTPSLKTYLRALPSGKHYGKGNCIVATDGSLRLRRKQEEGETMGAGVAWQQEAEVHREGGESLDGKGDNRSSKEDNSQGVGKEDHDGGRPNAPHATNVSRRVAGTLSSTRAELAAIAQAVELAPIGKDLVILVDSAAAIRRLTWFRRRDFRPHPSRTKDYDIVQEIVMGIYKRGGKGAHTTLVKVHGHTGEPLHAVADAMATEGADRKIEDDERPLYEIPETTKLTFLSKGRNRGREDKGQWSPKIKARIREHEAAMLWERRRAGTWAEKFHKREGVGRKELGEAIQRCEGWAVTGWIRSLTPHCYLVTSTYKKWRVRVDDTCLCGEGAETFLHLQLACKLTSRRAARQGAHDNVMRILEEEVMRDAPPGRRGVWDTRVRDLCSQVLSVAEREIMVRKWKGSIGGPNMDADFEKWHLVMQNKWRKMADRREQTRGEEHQGQRPSRLSGMTEEIERRRKEAAARQMATGKRKHGETPTPSWASRDMEIEVGNQKPDGLILDTEERAIYIIEGARCSDTAEAMEIVEVTKLHKYRALREELRRRYPGYQVKQLNFIIGIQGTIVEHRWRWNLTTLGIERRRQDRIIRKCMTASVEGMQRVLRAETRGGDG